MKVYKLVLKDIYNVNKQGSVIPKYTKALAGFFLYCILYISVYGYMYVCVTYLYIYEKIY